MNNDLWKAEKQWLDPDNDPYHDDEEDDDWDYQAEDEAEDEVLGDEWED